MIPTKVDSIQKRAGSLPQVDWEEALFPEADSKALKEELGVIAVSKTLSELNFRRSSEAEAAGYILVRDYIERRRAALWVHKDNLHVLHQAQGEIAKRRAQTEKKSKKKEAVKEKRKQERAEKMARVLAEFPYPLPSSVRESSLKASETLTAKESTLKNMKALVQRELEREIKSSCTKETLGEHIISLSFENSLHRCRVNLGQYIPPPETLQSLPQEEWLKRTQELALTARRKMIEAVEEELPRELRKLEAILARLPSVARERATEAVLQRLSDPFKASSGFYQELEDLVGSVSMHYLLNEIRDSLSAPFELQKKDKKGNFVVAKQSVSLPVDNRRIEVTIKGFSRKVNSPALSKGVPEAVAFLTREAQEDLEKQLQPWLELQRVLREELPRLLAREGCDKQKTVKSIQQKLKKANPNYSPDIMTGEILQKIASIGQNLDDLDTLHQLVNKEGLGSYKDFFKAARALDRRLVLYVGPTNSGKTWTVLNKLTECESGVYLAPLRLLALEGQEELEKRGVVASFLTGEERDIREDASFMASTIEMINLHKPVDAVLVDEVQLLSDRHRGWAWAQAIIGAPAKTVYMTGSPDAIPLVKALASYLGEPLEIHRTDRLTPLEPISKPLHLNRIRPGTAIIAFSKRDVLGLKQKLEKEHSVAVIYGALSPEVRREEARRFRSGEAQVLVATDAIAMGLNLPIETVAFWTTRKWNGQAEIDLPHAEIRQIAGRAGRFKIYDKGYAKAFSRNDAKRIREALESSGKPLRERVLVAPALDHVEAIGKGLGEERLHSILTTFREKIRFDTPLIKAMVTEDMLVLARRADKQRENLPLAIRYTWACAPVDQRSEPVVQAWHSWLSNASRGEASRLRDLNFNYENENETATSHDELHRAETYVKKLTLYAWLSYRFPELFPGLEECDRQRRVINGYIERSLRAKGIVRRCGDCGDPLAPMSRHPTCESCYQNRWSWESDFDDWY